MKIQIVDRDNGVLVSLPYAEKVLWVADKDYDFVKGIALTTNEGSVVQRVSIKRAIKKGQSFTIEFSPHEDPN